MSDLDQRVATLRREIDSVKAVLQSASDETERRMLHMRLNDAILASIRLIDDRIVAARNRRAQEREAAGQLLGERSVGDK